MKRIYVVASILVIALFLTSAVFAALMPRTPNVTSASNNGFTFSAVYDTDVANVGKNFVIHYKLVNNGYTANVSRYSYSGSFIMQMDQSNGNTSIPFNSAIGFQITNNTQFVMFIPGQTWQTDLVWNGTYYDSKSKLVTAPQAVYKLSSSATMRIANTTITVQLPTINITLKLP